MSCLTVGFWVVQDNVLTLDEMMENTNSFYTLVDDVSDHYHEYYDDYHDEF